MERYDSSFEIKSFDSDSGFFTGYGSVAGNIDSYGDVVAKGAFADTLAQHKAANTMPSMLLQHGMGDTVQCGLPVGSWSAMHEDDTGLWCAGNLCLDTQRGREAHALMKMTPRPALSGLSIGYKAVRWQIHGKNDPARRTLKAVKLYEVSLVDTPANSKARVQSVKYAVEGDRVTRALASLAAMWGEHDVAQRKRDFESELRRLGYSRDAAKRMTSERFAVQ